MTQNEIVDYFTSNGGLRCKYWTIQEIKEYIKLYFGKEQRVCRSTCELLKSTARIYQRN